MSRSNKSFWMETETRALPRWAPSTWDMYGICMGGMMGACTAPCPSDTNTDFCPVLSQELRAANIPKNSVTTFQNGHTVIRADQFDPDGWQLPEITDLCQNNDEGCATNYMSVIAHVYQRPICMDDDTPSGEHDPASTRSCRPRQKTTSNGNGPSRSHPTDIPTSSPRFKRGKQMLGAFQSHDRRTQRCDIVGIGGSAFL